MFSVVTGGALRDDTKNVSPSRNSYQMGLLFTSENGDFGAISVTE